MPTVGIATGAGRGMGRACARRLVGTAMLVESLRPLVSAGTAVVCFASMAPVLGVTEPHPAADAALDEPLHPDCIGRVRDALGAAVEQPGMGYAWAKRGVQRLV